MLEAVHVVDAAAQAGASVGGAAVVGGNEQRAPAPRLPRPGGGQVGVFWGRQAGWGYVRRCVRQLQAAAQHHSRRCLSAAD